MMLMYTAINIPYCSMGAVITPDNDERISLQSWRFFLATLGGAMSTFFMMPLAEYLGGADKLAGYRWAMAIMASAAVIMFWFCFANTRERIKAPPPTITTSRNCAICCAMTSGALSPCW